VSPSAIAVRAAGPADAARIAELHDRFKDYLRSLGDDTDFKFDARVYLRDGFGEHPAFGGLVAECDGVVAGYLLHHPAYDVDRAMRQLFVADLFVEERFRGRGVGRALMDGAAEVCSRMGGGEVLWTVFAPNRLAHDFYRGLGAEYLADLQLMRLAVRPRPA
jgi:GNAT superfamily N-acetyltransferase